MATTKSSPTLEKRDAPRRIPVTAIVTWWRGSANTTSRAGLRLSQPNDVPKPEVKPLEDPTHDLGCSLENHFGWNGVVKAAGRVPYSGSNRNVAARQLCDLDGLPGGAPSGVQPDSSCSGRGKTEESLPWDPGGTKQRPGVHGTNARAPPPPPSLPPSLPHACPPARSPSLPPPHPALPPSLPTCQPASLPPSLPACQTAGVFALSFHCLLVFAVPPSVPDSRSIKRPHALRWHFTLL